MDFTIEELSINAWPSLQTLLYDGWIIRFANGYGNRSNSINPIYPSKIELEEKINYCDKIFDRYKLPTTYKIIECEEHKSIEEKLGQLNYKKIHPTSIQTCKTIKILKNNYNGIIIENNFDNKWIDSVINFNKIEEKNIITFKGILKNIAGEKIVVYKKAENEIAGCSFGVIDNNYVGIFDIVVKESERGKGYGKEIVETILSEAKKKEVTNSYLQVMLDNPIALKLYKKLGFKEIYKYWYRKKQ